MEHKIERMIRLGIRSQSSLLKMFPSRELKKLMDEGRISRYRELTMKSAFGKRRKKYIWVYSVTQVGQ